MTTEELLRLTFLWLLNLHLDGSDLTREELRRAMPQDHPGLAAMEAWVKRKP